MGKMDHTVIIGKLVRATGGSQIQRHKEMLISGRSRDFFIVSMGEIGIIIDFEDMLCSRQWELRGAFSNFCIQTLSSNGVGWSWLHMWDIFE